MKKFFLPAFVLVGSIVCSYGQATLKQGSEMKYVFKKQPTVASFQSEDDTYYVVKSYDYSFPYPTLIAVSKEGNVSGVNVVKYQQGTMGNMMDLHNLVSVDNKMIALMESRNKSTNQNRLLARTLDGSGTLGTEEKEIGSFNFEKMGKSGDWYSTVTPDGKHLAIIGEVPGEKEEPIQFKYYFLDGDLKQLSAGQFTFPEVKKRVFVNNFYASDKGDFYLIKNESDKGNQFPVVYKAKTGETIGTVTTIMVEDPEQKIYNYTSAVQADGNLVIAGYFKKKGFLTIGDVQATGSWIYTTATGKVSTSPFQKPVSNLIAEGVVFNGKTAYLLGEQLKPEKETNTQQQNLAFEENYNYKHNDILVSAFDPTAGSKKFELTLSKNYSGRNFDQDLYPAFGVVDNKLAVVYNDSYDKYVPNKGYGGSKIPVLVYITNDGLMETPVHLEKEFGFPATGYTLYPRFATTTANGLVLLAGNGSTIKGVVIK